jgi:hypothetical protein
VRSSTCGKPGMPQPVAAPGRAAGTEVGLFGFQAEACLGQESADEGRTPACHATIATDTGTAESGAVNDARIFQAATTGAMWIGIEVAAEVFGPDGTAGHESP